MDPKVTADVLAVCDTLGVFDGRKYFKDPQCLSSAKDLVLHLRRDTPDHAVRRLLGEAQILQRDLIPITKLEDCEPDLAEVVLRLMVNLTNPPLLLYERGLPPKDKTIQNHFIIITRHLQAYKEAFIDEAFWTVIARKLGKLIENIETLLEDQKLTVERILILIRNVLQVPADPSEEMRNDDDASVHDQILWVMQRAGLLDLLLFIASSDSTREFCMHIIETLTLIFREHTGEQLATSKLERNQEDIINDARELTRALESERAKRNWRQFAGRSFGGTYVIRGLEAGSGHNQICHKPVQSLSDLSMDPQKKARKTPVNRREKIERNTIRRSTLSMRLMLKEFCTELLNGAYNYLMRLVKDRLTRERSQENDETYYLLAMRFFMEFNRFADANFTVARVSETMSIGTFHYVQGLISNYHELMVTDKDNLQLWSKRAHAALRAYQELLSTLYVMELTMETSDAAKVLQSSIFYLPEYRELCVGLLSSYESQKLSRNYFCNLVETNHIFLKMLQSFTRERKILVRGKKRGRGRRKEKRKNKRQKNTEGNWARIEAELESFLSSSFEPMEMIPFDAASDTPVDEQKGTTMSRIASFLSKEEFNEAVSLHRAAVEVWPDDHQLSKETEISSLKSIFLGASPLPDEEEEEDGEDGDEEIEEDEEFEEVEKGPSKESEFDFRGFMEKYTHQKIVMNYGNLFRNYETLPENVLHCIVKMFHRLVFDLGYPAILCQASIFCTFQSILRVTPLPSELKVAKEFFMHFWPKFVKLATSNPKMFVEILFWKTGREAMEIQEGYTPYAQIKAAEGSQKKKKSRGTLSPEEENEIMVLAEEFAALPREKGRKQVDWINERLINGPKVKKLVQNFLKERGLIISRKKQRKRASGTVQLEHERIHTPSVLDSSSESEREIQTTQHVTAPSDSDSDVSFSRIHTETKKNLPVDEPVEEAVENVTIQDSSASESEELRLTEPVLHSSDSGNVANTETKENPFLSSDSEEEGVRVSKKRIPLILSDSDASVD